MTAGALNADLVPSTDVSGYSSFMLQISGTFVGTLALQGSNDNTNFYQVFGSWVNNTPPVVTVTIPGIVSGSCNFRYFRVRMTAYTSGTATGTLELKTMPFAPTNTMAQVGGSVTANIGTSGSLALDATLTGGTQQTKLTDGTNIVNVLKSDGTAAGQNSQLVAGTYLSVPFTTTTVQAVGTTDAGNYNYVSVHTTTQGTSSNIIFQGSNDNTNWVSVVLLIASATGSISQNISTSGAARIDSGPLNFRYFRLNVTGISAGTTAGTIIFRTQAPPMIAQSTQVGSSTATGSAVPANAFMIGGNNGGNLTSINALTFSDAGSAAQVGLVTQALGQTYNGSTWDRVRSANAASNTTGTGLLGVGNLGYDGTNWQSIGAVAGDAGFNGLATSSATKTYTFTTSGSGAQLVTFSNGQNYIPTAGYAWIELVNATQGVGAVAVSQWSPTSGGTYIGTNNWGYSTNTTSSFGVPLSTNIIGWSAIHGNYFQISFSALTSGTVSGTITLRAMSQPVNGLSITGSVGTASAVVNIGQQTSNTSAVQLSASSTIPTNGLIIQALSTNTASVFIGGSGVTTATGFELTSGSSLTITSNLNTVYVIGSNATDKVCWSVT